MIVTSVLTILLVPVPFLANACVVTNQYSKSMALQARKEMLHKYRFLFFRFHPYAYYYGLVLLLRSLLICIVPVVARDDPGLQVFILSFIIIVFAEFQCYIQPWRAKVCNTVDAFLSVCLLSLLVCACLAAVFESNRKPLVLLCIGSLLGMALVTLFALAQSLLHMSRKCRRAQMYDFFLCHHKEHASAQVRFIKTCVTNMSNCRVFIDSDDLVNLDGLFDIVKNDVKVFVVVLTSHTLRRAWCCGEIVSAHATMLKMHTVVTATFVPPENAQMENLENYISSLDSTLSNYGISTKDVQQALSKLLHPATPCYILSSSPHRGTARFLSVSRSLLGHGDSSLGPKTLGGFSVAISASLADDEAVAISGFIAVALRLQLAYRDGGGEVVCLCDIEVGVGGLLDFEEARAAVVIYSSSTLHCIEQLASLVNIMEIAEAHQQNQTQFTVIPVHLPGVVFPSGKYFEEDFAALWSGREALSKSCHMLKTYFKHISIPLEVSASDGVLSAQVSLVFHRIPPSQKRKSWSSQGGCSSATASLFGAFNSVRSAASEEPWLPGYGHMSSRNSGFHGGTASSSKEEDLPSPWPSPDAGVVDEKEPQTQWNDLVLHAWEGQFAHIQI